MTFTDGITVPAQHFAAAWQNVLNAAANDAARPILHQTILVELYPSGDLRLTSTDSYMLLTTVVGDTIEIDDMETAPAESLIVEDQDNRGVVVLRWAYKLAAHARKNDLPDVEVKLTRRKREHDPDVPTLSPDLDGDVLVIDAPDESVALDVIEGEFPSWRGLFPKGKPKPTDRIGLNVELLARFGKLRDTSIGSVIELHGSLSPVVARIPGLADSGPVLAMLMPLRDAV